MGKKSKKKDKKNLEVTSQNVAKKAAKILNKKFTKDINSFLRKLIKVEKTLWKLSDKLEEVKNNYTNTLDDFQDFISIKKEEILSVAASALTQAEKSGGGKEEGSVNGGNAKAASRR